MPFFIIFFFAVTVAREVDLGIVSGTHSRVCLFTGCLLPTVLPMFVIVSKPRAPPVVIPYPYPDISIKAACAENDGFSTCFRY